MLFSQPEVASFLSDSFECAWESVRPVPRVMVDFGDGHTLERTLRGNIATYVCTSRAETIDLIPGLVDGKEYEARLRESLALLARVRARPAGATGSLKGVVAEWHRSLGFSVGAPSAAEVGRSNSGKRAVEFPLERGLMGSLADRNGSFGLESGSNADPAQVAFPSKLEVEGPLENELAPRRTVRDDSGLARDTLYAREQGYRRAHLFLADRALAHPSELRGDVYRELLHVDLDDPYLGLAPNVLGGEPGRH